MMIMDITLMLVGALIVTFSTIEGFARSLMQLIIFYVTSLILGMILLSINITQDMARNIAEMTGGLPNQTLFEALLFLVILIPTTLGIFLLTHFTMDNLQFSKIQWLDTVLAVITGLIFALIFMSLIANTWGIIVSTAWTPERTKITMYNAYSTSVLRIPMQKVLSIYHDLLFPFKMTRYPLVYNVVY